MILHMVIFLVLNSVLEAVFLADLKRDDSYSDLPAFDFYFMLEKVTTFLITGFILILTYTLN